MFCAVSSIDSVTGQHVVMQWIRSIFRSTRRLVGTDLDGNKYYEILREGRKPKREVVTQNKLKHADYKSGVIPHEWEAWLRGSVKDAPSHEDLIQEEHRQILLSQKVHELNERDQKLQEEAYNEGLVARPVGHASSPSYGRTRDTLGTQTTGRLFKPGAWDKQVDSKIKQKNDEAYQPESWKPP